MKYIKLLKPYTKRIDGTEADLIITEYGHKDGLLHAKAQIWNGKPLAGDDVCMDRLSSRRKLARAACTAHPDALPEVGNVEQALLDAALSLANSSPAATPTPAPDAAPDDTEQLAEALLAAPDLLDRLGGALHGLGLTGEDRNAKTVYLLLTARVLSHPVNGVIKGPSSAGKSYIVKTVLALLPPGAYRDLTTMTPRALVYDDAPLSHVVLVLYEAGALGHPDTPEGQALSYAVRSLLSEGRLSHLVVEKGEDGLMRTRHIVREGPTALLTTTTKISLDGELETRLLEMNARDDSEQTRGVLRQLGRQANGSAAEPPDTRPWQALQAVLQRRAPFAVVVPFAGVLAEQLPNDAVRMRRDFGTLLALIQASAVLHHRQRRTDGAVRIRASIDDYRVVYDLLKDAYAAASNQGCTQRVREAVEAVAAICEAKGPQPDPKAGGGVTYAAATVREVAERLSIDRTAAGRHLAKALAEGWLIDDSDGKPGKPRLYRAGEPLPTPRSALPTPEVVAAACPDDDPPDDDDQGCAGVQKVCTPPCTPSTATSSPSGMGCEGVQPNSGDAHHTYSPDTRPIVRWRPDPDGWDTAGRQYLPDDTPSERYALDMAGLTIGLELDGRRYVMRPQASADGGWEEL